MKSKKIKTRYMSSNAAERDCPKNGIIHALPGIARKEDYYVIEMPGDAIIKLLPQTISKYNSKFWNACHLITQGQSVLYASIYRTKHFLKSERILDCEAVEYLQGHRTPAEYWNGNINSRMETARISHQLCDASGQAGHDMRQTIRREMRGCYV